MNAPRTCRKHYRVKNCHVTSSKQFVSPSLAWYNSGPLGARYFYLQSAIFGPTLPSFHLKTETDCARYIFRMKLYPTLFNNVYCPLQPKLCADFPVTDSGLINWWIFCHSCNAVTCQILQLEAQSNDHLLGIMPIQCATSGDGLTFNQPTNYAV